MSLIKKTFCIKILLFFTYLISKTVSRFITKDNKLDIKQKRRIWCNIFINKLHKYKLKSGMKKLI